jgi:hypothetical protein
MQAVIKPPKPAAAFLIQLPADERGLPPDVVRRFDALHRKLARRDLRPKDREVAENELQALVGSLPAAREKASLDRSIAETVALAQAKGEDVKQTKTGTRILSRGGLFQAYEDGHMEPEHGPLSATDLYLAGKRYRDAYEIIEGMTTGGGTPAGFGPKAPQMRVIEAGADLEAMRAAITPRQRAVLDLVCGKDRRLRTAAAELRRGFPSVRNSLRGGLRAVAELKVDRDPVRLARLIHAAEEIARAQKSA